MAMNGKIPGRIATRVIPQDQELADRQWAEWRATRRRLLKASGFAAGALGLGGSALLSRPSRAAAQDETPKMGGAISMSLADDDVSSFDPIVPFDNMSIWTMLLIYDQVIRVDAEGTALEGGLAESWEVSDDNLTYTFHLRETNFHDDTPCTSEDVVFCLDRVVKGEESGWAFLFSAVDTIEAPDAQTVIITLKQAWAPFEADLALYGASIFPKAALEEQKEELWEHPIGTGPFMFDSWEKGAQIVLKKNPSYWDQGKPYLDELTFKVLTDSDARVLQLQGGELDIATDVPFNQIEPLSANPDYVLVPDAVAKIDYIGLNVTRAPFKDDKNLRQAINYAIDKDAIIQNVLFGAGQPANTYLPLMPGHDDAAPGYPFDLEKAKQLVAESNSKEGFEFTILSGVGDAVGNQVCQLVAASLAQIGGTVTIEQVEPGIGTERTHALDYDAGKAYYTTDIIDPDELTAFAVYSKGGAQAVWTGYQNDEVDKLVEDAQTELDPEKRQEIYNQIQAIHLDDAPFIFLFYPSGRTATKAAIKNFHVLPTGNYRLQEVWRDDV
jgi:peptide/nickel transport system substrate-binding protein